jgi:hypothetical protein
MTTALEGGKGSASRPGRSLPPGKTRYSLYSRLGGPQGWSGQRRKISPTPGFDFRTLQPVASRYTDYAIRPTLLVVLVCICSYLWSVLRYKCLFLVHIIRTRIDVSKDMRIHFYFSKPKGVRGQKNLGNTALDKWNILKEPLFLR